MWCYKNREAANFISSPYLVEIKYFKLIMGFKKLYFSVSNDNGQKLFESGHVCCDLLVSIDT